MGFHVYILRSQSNGRYYVSHTGNLARRIVEHNNNRIVDPSLPFRFTSSKIRLGESCRAAVSANFNQEFEANFSGI